MSLTARFISSLSPARSKNDRVSDPCNSRMYATHPHLHARILNPSRVEVRVHAAATSRLTMSRADPTTRPGTSRAASRTCVACCRSTCDIVQRTALVFRQVIERDDRREACCESGEFADAVELLLVLPQQVRADSSGGGLFPVRPQISHKRWARGY